jgi:signal transduction histidine kinase
LLNILQLYLIYSSFHIPIGQDELIGFFFAMLMTTTCSVVAHLNQKNVHRLRESEARRVQSETERLHEAKEAELARQALVNAEAAHRVQAAAEIAHQINNPLNYIQLSLLNMKSKLKEMESSLLHLLGHDESPEHTLVRDYYKSLLKDMKDPLIDAEKGVRQVTEAIAEVRSLSGLDGYEIEDISVQELIRSSIEKLLPLVPYEECSRLSFSQNIPQDWVMRGNRYLSKALFTKWFQCVLEHSTGPLQLTFHFDGATTFLTAAIAGTFNNLEIRQKTFQSSLLSLAHQSPIQFELEMSVSKLSLHHHLLDKPILQDPLSKVA